MAVAFDVFSNVAEGTGNLSWTHTPTGTPRGVIVFVVGNIGTDDITTVTYGSLTLTQVSGSPNLHTTGEAGAVHCFVGTSGIPTGAQTVTVTKSGGTAAHRAAAITLTANFDTRVQDSDGTINSDSQANPSVTLSLGGLSSFCAIGFHSGVGVVSQITPLTSWNSRLENDFGAQTAGWYTYDTIGTADVTAGWTQTADDACAIAIAITEATISPTGVASAAAFGTARIGDAGDVKCEVGTWTPAGSTPQTINLAAGAAFGTPLVLIAWTVGKDSAPSAGSFAATAFLSLGFGTRRGGATQQGCVGSTSDDNVATTAVARVSNSKLLHIFNAATATDYTVSLDSVADGSFTVSYSSAANANGDPIHYAVLGGFGLTDAIVLNWLMDGIGSTEVVTGTGFRPDLVMALDGAHSGNGTPFSSTTFLGLGCASSPTKSWSLALAMDGGDTTTGGMSWKRAIRTDALLERLDGTSDASDARWDLDSFDSDGATLGIVAAPDQTNLVCPLLFIKGGAWEAGTFAKSTTITGGAQTVNLADGGLTPVGLLLATTNQTAVGISAGDATIAIGAGSTPSTTRGSAVNNVLGIACPENINTTADRFRATDAIIEELTGGAVPLETSEAWYRAAAAGSFAIEWANPNGIVANLIGYLAFGKAGTANTINATSVASAFAAGTAKLNREIKPSAVAGAEAFGTAKLGRTIAPSGVAGAEAFGTAQLNRTLPAVGVASAAAFGTAQLNREIKPSAVASAEAIGAVRPTYIVAPTGVASAAAFGTAQLNRTLPAIGVASAEAFGTALLNLNIVAVGVASGEAIGTAEARSVQSITASAVAGAEAFGTARLNLAIVAAGVASGEAIGTARLNRNIIAAGVASGEAVGSASLVLIVRPSAVASAEAFGTARLNLAVRPVAVGSAEAIGAAKLAYVVAPAAVASGEAIGTARLDQNVAAVGVASAQAFGAARLDMRVLPVGVASGAAFGTATVSSGGQIITASGVASAFAAGVASLALTIACVGVASAEAIGTPALGRTVAPVAVGSGFAAGTAQLNRQIVASGIASGQAFGTASLVLAIRPASVASAEAFGTAALGRTVAPTAVGSAFAAGTARLDMAIVAVGVGSAEAIGTASLALVVRPVGVASAFAGGTASLTLEVRPSSIAGGEAFGAAIIVAGGNILPVGVASAFAAGTAVVLAQLTVQPNGVVSAAAMGVATLHLADTLFLEIDPASTDLVLDVDPIKSGL